MEDVHCNPIIAKSFDKQNSIFHRMYLQNMQLRGLICHKIYICMFTSLIIIKLFNHKTVDVRIILSPVHYNHKNIKVIHLHHTLGKKPF